MQNHVNKDWILAEREIMMDYIPVSYTHLTMRIQHNIAALNSYRNLTGNNNAVSKNLEKLSSGYRINRAGDDAARCV